MKLYGTVPSPYVRRLRLYMADRQYEFINSNIFGEDREEIKAKNPTLKIPMLEDPDLPGETLLDSGVIYRYLCDKFSDKPLNIRQQNLLTIIDAVNDSLVNTLLLKRGEFDVSEDRLYFNIQKERQKVSFDYLEQVASTDLVSDWNYAAISLFVLVEWAKFRDLYNFDDYPNLNAFVENNKHQLDVEVTAPQ